MSYRSYDSTTRDIVRSMVSYWTNEIQGISGEISEYDEEYLEEHMHIDVWSYLKVDNINRLRVDNTFTGANPYGDKTEFPVITVGLIIGEDMIPNWWDEIYYLLSDIVRHEIEHLTQDGIYGKCNKPSSYEEQKVRKMVEVGLMGQSTYLMMPSEVDANLQGLRYKAKKLKTSIGAQINDYLEQIVMSEKEKQDVLNVWRKRAKQLGFNQSF